MQIKKIPGNWDYSTIEVIEDNFETVSSIESKLIKDIFSSDPMDLDTYINGLDRSNAPNLSALNDFGIAFQAYLDGVIHKVDIYASTKGKFVVGLAKQDVGSTYSEIIMTKEVDVSRGWNTVVLNFPIERNSGYNLFKRNLGETVFTKTTPVYGWNTYPFMENGVNFQGGMYLNQSGTFVVYSTFYNIQIVNNLAQIYQLMTNSVKPRKQYHVGQNPPTDAEIWFKPLE